MTAARGGGVNLASLTDVVLRYKFKYQLKSYLINKLNTN